MTSQANQASQQAQGFEAGGPWFRAGAGSRIAAAARSWARAAWAVHAPLALITVASAALLAASFVLGLIDGRQVLAAPVWMKPAKFAASVGLMAPVVAWIVGQMTGAPARRARRIRRAGTVIAVVAALELLVITVQAVRGVPSHFNNATAIDAALFSFMGASISILWIAELVIAAATFRHTFKTPARTWAIRLGLAASLLGGAVGFVMPRPTGAQMQSLRAGRPTPMVGAHAVGVPDGGPGLPMTRWSVEGGDLRVPHFIGMHALQVLPIAAWLLERRRRRAAAGAPVILLGAAWIALTLATLAQALRGRPVVSFDASVAGAALLVAIAVAHLARPAADAHQPVGRTSSGARSDVERVALG